MNPPSADGAETRSVFERRSQIAATAILLGAALWFRVIDLSSTPGINGDEGWWGIQALRWLHGEPYESRTTSGNPIDLAFLIPLGLLHALAPPSFLLLRVLPAFSNLLALALGFWLVRRLYGPRTAWIQTVALALVPTAIAHSRFCQDPSQSILWTSLVFHLSLLGLKERERWIRHLACALLAFPVAVWSHPTNAFVAPVLVLPFVPVLRSRFPTSRRARVWLLAAGSGSAVLAGWLALAVAPFVLDSIVGANAFPNERMGPSAARLADGGQWLLYLRNYGRLFSGVTVYRYLSGAELAELAYDGISSVVAIAVIGWMVAVLARHRASVDGGLLFGWASTWLLFYVLAGPGAIEPHFERWGLCLIPAAVLVTARALDAATQTGPTIRIAAMVGAVALATGLVASFYVNYFREFSTTGGRSHRTFVTAQVEPKQQAIEQILARSDDLGGAVIVAQEWWHYWPIAYLARAHPQLRVHPDLDAMDARELRDALAGDRLFFVEFTGSPEHARALDWIRRRQLRWQASSVRDASGRDLLAVLQVGPALATGEAPPVTP